MKASYFNFSAFLLLVTLFALGSCQRQYDEPPTGELPNLEANMTIRELINMAASTPVAIGDRVIQGTVIADDQSGNFYKQIIIQDSTGGLRIDIDAFSLYTDYPIGRQVWVKCNGLYAWKDGDVVALVGSSNTNNSRIPQAIFRQYIIGGERNKPLEPKLRTLTTLTPADYNTLVKLENVEFADCYAGSSYAFPSTQESRNTKLIECATSREIVVRNSGFAAFAGQLMPTGNGSITAVYNSFSNTRQLFIRNTTDVNTMTGQRCTPLTTYTQESITDLRSQFAGAPATATGKIKGIVISAKSGTWFDDQLVIQEPNGAGILISFDARHSFTKGDYVEVKVGGLLLEEKNGVLRVSNVPICRATALPNPNGLAITPRVTTAADILANANLWESTLVQVNNATVNGAATFGDFNVMMNDPTGSVTLWNRGADFASDPLPAGSGTVTSVVSEYNGTVQLNLRSLLDLNLTGSGGGGGGGTLNRLSIQDVRNLFTGSSATAPAQTKIVGIVISDISGGNFNNRNVVVQEVGGAGITVRFDATHSFNLGDELEVNISGRTIEEFNGLLQINGIPLTDATVLSNNNTITPRVATVQDITSNANNWESTLIQVQNASLSGGNTYGSSGVMLNDATGSISMFSAFANFATTSLPTGTGNVTAVVGDFNGTQLKIRNLSDVTISGGGGGGGPTTFISILDVRNIFAGGGTSVPASRSIGGIVISDKDAGNITGRNIVIQQTGGSGIVVRFANNNTSFSLGDSITIDISNGTLSEFNGLLQISGVSNANGTVISSNNSITPRVATVQDILNNAETWESTLVQINSATITGSSTYAGGTTVTDATGNINMFTRNSATFSGNALPTGSVNITAIVSEFNGYQVNIRNASDVQ